MKILSFTWFLSEKTNFEFKDTSNKIKQQQHKLMLMLEELKSRIANEFIGVEIMNFEKKNRNLFCNKLNSSDKSYLINNALIIDIYNKEKKNDLSDIYRTINSIQKTSLSIIEIPLD